MVYHTTVLFYLIWSPPLPTGSNVDSSIIEQNLPGSLKFIAINPIKIFAMANILGGYKLLLTTLYSSLFCNLPFSLPINKAKMLKWKKLCVLFYNGLWHLIHYYWNSQFPINLYWIVTLPYRPEHCLLNVENNISIKTKFKRRYETDTNFITCTSKYPSLSKSELIYEKGK